MPTDSDRQRRSSAVHYHRHRLGWSEQLSRHRRHGLSEVRFRLLSFGWLEEQIHHQNRRRRRHQTDHRPLAMSQQTQPLRAVVGPDRSALLVAMPEQRALP